MFSGNPGPSTVLVLPCFNEAGRLDINAFTRFAERHREVGFLFVNDGSRDYTLQLLNSLAARLPGSASVLDLAVNRGKGEAVRRGMLEALRTDASAVGFWDADLSTPLEAVLDFLSVLHDRPSCEMVFGARVKLLGRAISRRPHRHYLGRVFATAASVALRLAIYDTQCGAKLFRVTSQLEEALREPFCARWIFDVEILARYRLLHRNGACSRPLEDLVYEYPLHTWADVPGSKLGLADYLSAARDLTRIYWKYLR